MEHVLDATYRLVDPINGTHRGYIVAQQVEYESTLEGQRRKRQ
jgi:hypothetical protein